MSFDRLKVEIFGASHTESIGAVVQGFPSGFKVDLKALEQFAKRRLSTGKFTTPRKEEDKFTVTGLVDGKILGKIAFEIENKNVKSSDYKKINSIPRPLPPDTRGRRPDRPRDRHVRGHEREDPELDIPWGRALHWQAPLGADRLLGGPVQGRQDLGSRLDRGLTRRRRTPRTPGAGPRPSRM